MCLELWNLNVLGGIDGGGGAVYIPDAATPRKSLVEVSGDARARESFIGRCCCVVVRAAILTWGLI